MKRILTLIITAVCVVLLITACGGKQLTMKEAESIVLMNEEDNTSIEITDTKTVEKITDDINSLSLKKGKYTQIPPGWIFQLIWRDANDKTIGVIGIVDESTIGYNDYYYSISDGGIDMSFFDELLDSQP